MRSLLNNKYIREEFEKSIYDDTKVNNIYIEEKKKKKPNASNYEILGMKKKISQ